MTPVLLPSRFRRPRRDDRGSQLVEFADTARKELFNLHFQHATGQLENTARLKAAKTDLARALTVAQQRGVDPTEIKKSDG